MNNEALRLMSLPAMQEKFREAMGPWQEGDPYYSYLDRVGGFVEDQVCEDFNNGEFEGVVRLPLPIDPNNPERGLWGMVDWKRWRAVQDITDMSGLTWLFWTPFESNTVRIRDTITLALLRALMHQWQIEEVKGCS
jgi:hypothetical protein